MEPEGKAYGYSIRIRYKVKMNLNIDMMNRHTENMEYYKIFLSDSLKKPFENVVGLKPSSI